MELRALLALSLLLVVPRFAHAQAGGIAVGAAAPGAAVTTLDGASVDLSSYIGKAPVVLEFWATWCPLCKQLEPAMSAARQKYAGRVTFVSVGVPNSQSPEGQKAFAAAHGMKGVLVFDRDSRAVKAYAAPHTSYVVAIDKAGKVVYTGVGGEQDIEAAVALALQTPAATRASGGR
jgi:thiol-disulfide isomerase/thioredoxin